MAILMPPWRMTSAMRAYLTLFCSFFCARAVQKYLNVLLTCVSLHAPGSRTNAREDLLVRAELAEDRASRDDSKTDPDAPDDTTEDGYDLMSEQLQRRARGVSGGRRDSEREHSREGRRG